MYPYLRANAFIFLNYPVNTLCRVIGKELQQEKLNDTRIIDVAFKKLRITTLLKTAIHS